MSRYMNTDMQVYVTETKHSGIVQHELWGAGGDFPDQVLRLSLWLVAWL